jgi:hypothetical protein
VLTPVDVILHALMQATSSDKDITLEPEPNIRYRPDDGLV